MAPPRQNRPDRPITCACSGCPSRHRRCEACSRHDFWEEIMHRLTRAASLAALAFVLSAPALAQAAPQAMANPPRTSWGAPDLQGFWSNQSVTTLTRGANIPNLVLTPEEAAK